MYIVHSLFAHSLSCRFAPTCARSKDLAYKVYRSFGLSKDHHSLCIIIILISLPSLERIKLRIQPKGFTQTLDHDCYMIGSLNVLDIVCYIQEAYRSAQHFVLGIRSQVSSLRIKVAKRCQTIQRYISCFYRGHVWTLLNTAIWSYAMCWNSSTTLYSIQQNTSVAHSLSKHL